MGVHPERWALHWGAATSAQLSNGEDPSSRTAEERRSCWSTLTGTQAYAACEQGQPKLCETTCCSASHHLYWAVSLLSHMLSSYCSVIAFAASHLHPAHKCISDAVSEAHVQNEAQTLQEIQLTFTNFSGSLQNLTGCNTLKTDQNKCTKTELSGWWQFTHFNWGGDISEWKWAETEKENAAIDDKRKAQCGAALFATSILRPCINFACNKLDYQHKINIIKSVHNIDF